VKIAALKAHSLLKNGMFFRSFEEALPKSTMKADNLKPTLHVLCRVPKVTCVGQISPNPFHVILNENTPETISVEQAPASNVTNGAK